MFLVDYKKDFVGKQWKAERYKWEAVKRFQDHWDVTAPNFIEMFNRSTDKTGNLLASMNHFPKGMIQDFAKADAEAVRAMFINLFDESRDLQERVDQFLSDSDALKLKYNDGTWKQHFQNTNSISTYLWLRYPNKYYIYKYSEYVKVAEALDSTFVPKKGSTSNLVGGFNLYNEINDYLLSDGELVESFKSVLDDNCFADPFLKTLTIDVGFYISRFLVEKPTKSEDEWFPSSYSPKLTVEQWLALLNNKAVFFPDSLAIMKRLKDYGGAATCSQLAVKYGETKNFYNVGSSSLAKRIALATSCPVMENESESSKWWPILYLGKPADKKSDGSYIWKLRDELSQALDGFDLSAIPLFAGQQSADGMDFESAESQGYWWLNANPKIWRFSAIDIGAIQSYTLVNENGNKRRIYQNFLDAKCLRRVPASRGYRVCLSRNCRL